MSLRWTASLVTKLTVYFTTVLVILWLLVEYQSYRNSFNINLSKSLETYGKLSKVKAEVSNNLFIKISDDARQLEQQFRQVSVMGQVNKQDLVSHYRALGGQGGGESDQEDTLSMWAVQTLGSAGKRDYLDTFIIQPNQGVSIYTSPATSKVQLQQNIEDIKQLSRQSSTTGYRWSQLIQDEQSSGYSLRVSYSREPSSLNALQVGFSVDLSSIISLNHAVSPSETSFLMTDTGAVLSQRALSLSPDILRRLKGYLSRDAPEIAVRLTAPLESFYVIAEPISTLGWWQVTLISHHELTQIAAQPFFEQLPKSLLILSSMIFILLRILRICLANPVGEFVNIINRNALPTAERRLPDNRKDELGEIAEAYNKLLDTVKSHYDELEQKVALRTHELLLATQAAEKANERKTEHLTSISHEIRTPLNGILGALELLNYTQLTSKQSDLCDTAHNCADSLLSIISNLLDFSRIEADQLSLNLQSYSILKLADDAMLTIQSWVMKKPITLSCLVSSDVPEMATLDPVRVRQILVNLLGNAAKFTERGQVSLLIEVVDTILYFRVQDTGGGIALEDQHKIFEPFVQTCHHKVGTGLGLPISAKLAAKMQGKLTLCSETDIGSTFTLAIPLVDASQPLSCADIGGSDSATSRASLKRITAPPRLHPQLAMWGIEVVAGENPDLDDPALAHLPARLWQRLHDMHANVPRQSQRNPTLQPLPWRLKILLVDDIDTNRDIISAMITQLGQEVIAVGSGEEALAIGQRHIFDLVLMDIRMQGLDGYQTTQVWREDAAILDGDCPIFALTANANSQEDATIQAKGMNSYLTKPVTLAQLYQAIEKAAQLQLARDMSLVENVEMIQDGAIFDLTQPKLQLKLAQHLTEMLHQAKEQAQSQQWQALGDTLHTIKGSAGIAALDGIAKQAATLEAELASKHALSWDDFSKLYTLIHQYHQSLD